MSCQTPGASSSSGVTGSAHANGSLLPPRLYRSEPARPGGDGVVSEYGRAPSLFFRNLDECHKCLCRQEQRPVNPGLVSSGLCLFGALYSESFRWLEPSRSKTAQAPSCIELGQRSLEAVYFAGRRDPGFEKAFTPVLVTFVQKTPARILLCRAYCSEGFAASMIGGWLTVPPSRDLLGQASRLPDG